MNERTRISVEAFLALPESNLPCELIDGEVIMSPAPEDKHQLISMQGLHVLLRLVNPQELRHAPTDLVLGEDFLQPDIFWVSPQNTTCVLIDGGKRWQGAPDLVVEITSPGQEKRDTDVKFAIYQRYGVREYWIVNPKLRQISVYALQDAAFVLIGHFTPEQTFTSPVLNGALIDVGQILA
jgi:Uma2 family endonuclease